MCGVRTAFSVAVLEKREKNICECLTTTANSSGFGNARRPSVTHPGKNSSSEFLPLWWMVTTQHQQFLQLVSGGDLSQSMINSIITILLSSSSNHLCIQNNVLEIQELQYHVSASSLNGKDSDNAGKALKGS